MSVSWDDAPKLAPNDFYKLVCEDYLPAGVQGGVEKSDLMILNFADPKEADKYMPFRVFLNDTRDKPEHLDEDIWAQIQERNQQLKEMIFEAFGFDDKADKPGMLLNDRLAVFNPLRGKSTGKNKLRVGQRDQGGATVNTLILPRNPAPQGDYYLEILAADYKEKAELGMRGWVTMTVGIVGQDEEGKPYTPIRGLETMVKFRWSKEFMPRDEATRKGFKSERDYMALVQQDAEKAQRICATFGLPKPELAEDTDNLYLQWPSDIRQLLVKGLRSRKSIRLTQVLDNGERFNRPMWPALPR